MYLLALKFEYFTISLYRTLFLKEIDKVKKNGHNHPSLLIWIMYSCTLYMTTLWRLRVDHLDIEREVTAYFNKSPLWLQKRFVGGVRCGGHSII